MARLPDISEQRSPVPSPPTGVASHSVDFSGAIRGTRKLQQAGRNISTAAEIFDREMARIDNDMAEEAINRASEYELELAYGEDGYLKKKGGDALRGNLLEDYRGRFDRKAEELTDGLGNSRQKEFFQKKFAVLKAQMGEDIFRHIVRERQVHASNVYESTIEAEKARATSKHNNQGAIDFSSARIENTVRRRGDDLGWTEEQVAQEIEKQKTDLHSAIAQRIMVDDPLGAYEYLKRNEGSMNAETFSRLKYTATQRAVALADRIEKMEDERTKKQQEARFLDLFFRISDPKEGDAPVTEATINNHGRNREIDLQQYGVLIKAMRGADVQDDPDTVLNLEFLARYGSDTLPDAIAEALDSQLVTLKTAAPILRRYYEGLEQGGIFNEYEVKVAMQEIEDAIGGKVGIGVSLAPPVARRINNALRDFRDAIRADPSQNPRELADVLISRYQPIDTVWDQPLPIALEGSLTNPDIPATLKKLEEMHSRGQLSEDDYLTQVERAQNLERFVEEMARRREEAQQRLEALKRVR